MRSIQFLFICMMAVGTAMIVSGLVSMNAPPVICTAPPVLYAAPFVHESSPVPWIAQYKDMRPKTSDTTRQWCIVTMPHASIDTLIIQYPGRDTMVLRRIGDWQSP